MIDNPQTDPYADGMCTFGEDQAPGAGCIKPAGHDGAHCVVPGDTDAEPAPPVRYPHRDGDFTVLGPEIFTDGTVISWRGENFVRQADPAVLPAVPVPPTTVRAAVLREAADAVAELVADGEHDPDCLVDELRRMADEAQQQETRTPCSEPNACDPDGDLCDQHETERAHAEGEHAFCGVTCEAEFPTEMLRNGILAKGYPGTAGMLDELLRRARAGRQP